MYECYLVIFPESSTEKWGTEKSRFYGNKIWWQLTQMETISQLPSGVMMKKHNSFN